MPDDIWAETIHADKTSKAELVYNQGTDTRYWTSDWPKYLAGLQKRTSADLSLYIREAILVLKLSVVSANAMVG